MKRRLPATLALATLALTACALMEPQASLREHVRAGGGEPQALFVGAARVALTPVDHAVPLAGFGPRPKLVVEVDRTRSGQPLDLFARALSIRGEEEIDSERPRRRSLERVVLASIDQLIVTADFKRRVRSRLLGLAAVRHPELDLAHTELILTATHTHEGIGGFWPSLLPEWASIGPYDAEQTRETTTRVARAILAAVEQEQPARLATGAASCPELVQSRAIQTSLVDPELLALAFDKPDGGPIARVVVFASHPTELYGTEHLSPAWPGTACTELEHPGGVAVILQGGLGDQRPLFPKDLFAREPVAGADGAEGQPRLARSQAYGRLVAEAAERALETRERAPRACLRLARAPFALPFPTLGVCPIPVLDRLLAAPIVLPDWPSETTLEVLRLGDVALAFAPFELCAGTSIRAKARIRAQGFEDAAVVSLANDWLGYAPDIVPWPWTTSGSASFGGVGMGYAVGERLAAMAERVSPAVRR